MCNSYYHCSIHSAVCQLRFGDELAGEPRSYQVIKFTSL